MPITSGPPSASIRIGEPDDAPPVSQVCRISEGASAKSRVICSQSAASKLFATLQGLRIGGLPGRVVAMVGDLEHVPGAGLAQDLLDRQHAQLEHALGAGGTGQPHQCPVARGIDRRPHAQAERARHHVLRRGTAGVSGDAGVVAHGIEVAREPEIGGAAGRSPAVPCRQWLAVAITSLATQNAVHTMGRRILKRRPIFSCTSLYLAGSGPRSSLPNTATGWTVDRDPGAEPAARREPGPPPRSPPAPTPARPRTLCAGRPIPPVA